MASNIKDIRLDVPIILNARWSFDKTDRRLIDDQIIGIQNHLIDSLLDGCHSTWVTVDGSSAALAVGDLVCTVATSQGKITVTKALPAALAAANSVFGVVMVAAKPFAKTRVAFNGVVSAAITGLPASTGVCIVDSDGRCSRVDAAVASDYVVGTTDAVGTLTIAKIVPSVGALGDLVLAGDLGNSNASPRVIHLSGPGGSSPLGVDAKKWTIGPGTTYPFPFQVGNCQTSGTTPDSTAVNLAQVTNSCADYFGSVVGRDSASGDAYRATISALFKRASGAPSVFGTVTLTPHPDNPAAVSTWTVGLAANGTNDGVVTVCTGQSGKTVDWSVYLQQQSISNGVAPTAPGITSVTPDHGALAGGTSLTIAGIRFTGTNTTNGVKVNGVNCTSIVVVSDISITCVAPAGSVSGATTITVNNGSGTDSATYTYDAGSFSWSFPATGSIVGFWDPVDATKVTSSGGTASQVNDVSGGTLHLTQATGANQPTYPSLINGHNALGQGGSSKMATGAITALTDFTVVMGVKPSDVTGDNTFVTLGSFNPEIGIKDGNIHVYLGAYYVGSTTISNGQTRVLVAKRVGTTLTLYVDGVQQNINGGGTSVTVSGAGTGTTVGIMYDGSLTFAKGTLGPIGVWSSGLNDTDRNSIESQITTRLA